MYSCENCGSEYTDIFCVSDGLFCPYWPQVDHGIKSFIDFFEITTKELVKENLRERCIYQANLNGEELWFKYMRSYLKKCLNQNTSLDFTDECSNKVLESLDINV
jgi:hypothetical protein